MIELFTLVNDRVEHIQHTQLARTMRWLATARHEMVWIRCTRPDEQALSFLSDISDIEKEHFREVIEEEERPKVSVTKQLEIVYSVPATEEDEVVTRPFYIYEKGNKIVTIEKSKNRSMEELAVAMRNNKRRFLFKRNVGVFVSYVLDKFNDEFLRFIDHIAVRVDVFSERRGLAEENIEKIYDSSVTLSYFNQALIANLEVLNELRKTYHRLFTADNRRQFTEVYYDLLQVRDTEKVQRESIANLFNMQSIIASNRLNDFMKKVTVIAILIAVPTFVSGIYGMNVQLPFSEEPNIFWFLMTVMAIFSLGLIVLFWLADRR